MFLARIPILFTLIVASATPVLAQAQLGTLGGVVRDSTGGVVVGATVTLTNQETGATRTTRTSSDGTYSVTSLPLGPYTVAAEFAGFGRALQRDVRVTGGVSDFNQNLAQ